MAKSTLNSELPIDKLIELSKSCNEDRWNKYYLNLKRASIVLSPASAGHPSGQFLFDFAGVKNHLAECEQGALSAERYLRNLWTRGEYHSQINGQASKGLPTGQGAEDICEAAVRLKLFCEEVAVLTKYVEEHHSTEQTREKARRAYQGVCKREGAAENHRIRWVDGMGVDAKGNITELGIHVDDYLTEVQNRKKLRREARLRKAEAA
ncbi:MAG: hypothetical protein EHM12_13300 [Dehalococcoidia bacterium]|nr:MAG: hypothetical protein EHM12_13300 [Dehalococcoidia bacterium]